MYSLKRSFKTDPPVTPFATKDDLYSRGKARIFVSDFIWARTAHVIHRLAGSCPVLLILFLFFPSYKEINTEWEWDDVCHVML